MSKPHFFASVMPSAPDRSTVYTSVFGLALLPLLDCKACNAYSANIQRGGRSSGRLGQNRFDITMGNRLFSK
ncbi:hypothetical protein SCP_0112000 [Sparassis crispa]|uniref:Uncharacterized protein n=1 Tax=Sparassis crispa TaxID=139825 RepID=A0A401G814_9APHY|nr:hypothetical protein SCP_0112000 [Sparassis crispa]GBE78315.1 hypothetical protein SCP_0112000 [Sparassis crispa]